MARDYQTSIPTHPNLYHPNSREMPLFVTEPETGVNESTGLLLLISDFGESSDSESYKETRENFSDKYNVITVQCGYFGSRFMNEPLAPRFIFDIEALKKRFSEEEWAEIYVNDIVQIDALKEIGSKYPIRMEGLQSLEETPEHYNDMGIMQALDNVAAVLSAIEIIKDNGYSFDAVKIMIYGHGHGAYLAYLCNAIAPKLFSMIIDCNGWLFPSYLKQPRVLNLQQGKLIYSIVFDYLARNLPYDTEFLTLSSLYRKFKNNANIVCFHNSDNSPEARSKQIFAQSLDLCMYNESASEVGSIDLEYSQLFDYVMTNIKLDIEYRHRIQFPAVQLETKEYRYVIDYESGMPLMNRIPKSHSY